MTSETGIGWSFLRAWIDVLNEQPTSHLTVVTAARFATKLMEDLRSRGLLGRVEVDAVELPRALGWLTAPRLTRLEYLVWCFRARRRINQITARRPATVAHHPIFATEVLPSPITHARAHLRVWGPVGSTGSTRVYWLPPRDRNAIKQLTTQFIRNVVARVPAWWTGRRMDVVLAQSTGSHTAFRALGLHSEVFPNIVLRREAMADIEAARVLRASRNGLITHSDRALSLIAVGHLIPRKRWELAIQALKDPLLDGARLRFVGRPLEGVDDYLPAFATRLGVADRVDFIGKVPRSEALRLMAEADVLVHPSGREGASGVVGEATALGLPVVCFAGTGSAIGVELLPGSGIVVDPRDGGPTGLARAIIAAASLTPTPYDGWSETRFGVELDHLLARAISSPSRR